MAETITVSTLHCYLAMSNDDAIPAALDAMAIA